MMAFSVRLCVLFSVSFVVEGTLTPDSTGPLDCGSQRTFTCSVTGAAWIVRGLSGISEIRDTGLSLANNHARITTNDTSGFTPISTITITGFNTSDNGGTIQCIDLADDSVQGMASISVGLPICPTNFSANRDDDFTSATVTYQLATTPPVTSTTVTYCPTSSLNCGNSRNCTTSPCTISGLDPCVEYNLSAIPTNNCGSPTGCDSMVVPAKGTPSCANISSLQNVIGDVCSVNLTWQQPDTPPVTSTTVTYCSTSSSCVNMTCTSPCIISGLDPGTEYQFTVTPNNNCGSPTGCTGNMDTVETRSDCVPESMLPVWVIIIIVIVVIILIVALTTAVVFIVICCCCAAVSAWLIATCCCCCKQANKNRNKPERFNRPPDEYTDPKKVREKKEKEEKIQYAALEFSEQAGSSGEKPIRSKEEPVQYLSVEQA